MHAIQRALSVEEMKQLARRRLPRVVFDYVEGGLGRELGLDRNESAFRAVRLRPRFLRDVQHCDPQVTLFGRTYARPFGIAPTGGVGLLRPRGDWMLLRAARAANIPMMVSGAADIRIEDAAELAPEHAWYQLYCAKDRNIVTGMIDRCRHAGLQTLVLTVDTPARRRRERNSRNGFTYTPRYTPRLVWDGLSHPAWLFDYLRHGGPPSFRNWEPYAGNDKRQAVALFQSESPAIQSWDDVARYRERWPHRFVLKGILHPEDAEQAARLGVDGVIVSNHGARQLDESITSLQALPEVVAAVGERMSVMLDSGIRTGADIVAAYAIGAKFVFTGRATLYGLAAGGEAGVRRVIDLLTEDVVGVMGMTGNNSLRDLPPDLVVPTKRLSAD